MNDDVRKYIYGTVTVFLLGLLAWVAVVYVSSCGVTLACKQGTLPVERTPIPTMLPASLPALGSERQTDGESCRIVAVDLIAAWVSANSPETEAFEVVDANGVNCEATFADAALLFNEPNIWNSGSAACASCHVADVAASPAQLDLTTYAGVMSGSRRADAESKGTDILGGGSWEKSLLYESLATSKAGVSGHTTAVSPGAFIFAGKPIPEPTPTP